METDTLKVDLVDFEGFFHPPPVSVNVSFFYL
jgi:hypothetical protein